MRYMRLDGVRTAAVAALTALVAVPSAAQESVALSGDRVAIYNLAGRVDVVRGSGSDVRVQVTRGGSDAEQLEVAVDRIDGRNVMRVLYPSDEIVYQVPGRGRYNTQIGVRDDGTFGSGGRRVRVRSSGSGLDAHADLRIEVPAGRDVAVYVAMGEAEARDLSSDLTLDLGSGRVTVERITGRVSIDTGSGSVEVAGVDGELEVDTGSGGIRVEDVTGGRVSIDTGSGTVTAARITTERLIIDTGSGGIRVTDLSASDVELDTGSGSITAVLTRATERLLVDTGSGSVDLTLPEGIDAEVQLDTGSGSIDVDLPLQVRVMRRDRVEGQLGEGRGLIEVDTGSGSIRLRRN